LHSRDDGIDSLVAMPYTALKSAAWIDKGATRVQQDSRRKEHSTRPSIKMHFKFPLAT
jgi:hypothetical protein